MNATFVTEGASSYAAQVTGIGADDFIALVLKKGRPWLRRAGLPTTSDDLALFAGLVYRKASELAQADRLDDEDWQAASDVLDELITDRDAELLVELIPLSVGEPVGSMTPEVTAVYDALLDVVGGMREAWEDTP